MQTNPCTVATPQRWNDNRAVARCQVRYGSFWVELAHEPCLPWRIQDLRQQICDFEDEVIDIITAEWKQVPPEKISVLDAGNKKKGKGK
eukprot:s3093_g3.t1